MSDVLDGISRALSVPYAAQQQGETTAMDYGLAEAARVIRPTVRWWWGERKLDGSRGAYCYLCGGMVVTWDTRYPITHEAQAAIADHRASVHGAPARRAVVEGLPIEGSSQHG